MNKDSNNKFLIVILIILGVIAGILYFIDDKEEEVTSKEPAYSLLKDYSRFFTVNSCVYKYITYSMSDKTEDLLNVLDKNFIEKNGINSDNVYQHINKLNGSYSFKAKKIYYQKVSDTYFKYYVYGYLIQDVIDSEGVKEDYYVIVNMDLEKQIFSITPYDGKIFKEAK